MNCLIIIRPCTWESVTHDFWSRPSLSGQYGLWTGRDLYRARPFSWTRISVISVSSEGPSRFVDSCDMWYKLFCFWKEKQVTWQIIPTIVYRFSVWEFLNPITFSAAWVKLITTYTFVFWTLQKKKKIEKDAAFFCHCQLISQRPTVFLLQCTCTCSTLFYYTHVVRAGPEGSRMNL